jgi:hypothetical protein
MAVVILSNGQLAISIAQTPGGSFFLPFTYCLLLIAYCLLLIAYCKFLTVFACIVELILLGFLI